MALNFESWWGGLGHITKHLALCVVGTSACVTTGIISPAHLAIYLQGSGGWLEMLYRPVTAALCFGGFSMSWLMTVPTFITYLNRNEQGTFAGRPVDFIWMLLFFAYAAGGVAAALGFYWTNFSMLLALCWVQCKRSPGDRTSFFGFEFASAYFPWVLVAFNFVVSQSLLPELTGILVGHLYVFFQDVYPTTHGKRWLETPRWLASALGRLGIRNSGAPRTGGIGGGVQPPQQPELPAAPAWGRGRVLGAQ